MEDRRKFFRFQTPINVKYRLETDKDEEICRTKDISRGGVAFSTDRKLAKDDTLKMEFEIPGDNVPAFAQGMVAWVKKNEKKTFSAGIRLIEITGFDRSRILEYAYKQWLKIKNITR